MFRWLSYNYRVVCSEEELVYVREVRTVSMRTRVDYYAHHTSNPMDVSTPLKSHSMSEESASMMT
jgi:hypothetical protein